MAYVFGEKYFITFHWIWHNYKTG